MFLIILMLLQKPSQKANESMTVTRGSAAKKELPTKPDPLLSANKKLTPKSKAVVPTPQSVQELLDHFPDNEILDDEDDDDGNVDDNQSMGEDNGKDSDYLQTNEFSEPEDMLEGIRGTVAKVVDNDLGGDLNAKHEWFDGEMAEEIIFSNADIEGEAEDEDNDEDDGDGGAGEVLEEVDENRK